MSTDLVEDALATHRLTKLVLDDRLTAPLRDRLFKRFPPESTKIGYLFTCPWCTSIWLGAGVATARLVAPRAWRPIARMLAFSSATGLLEELT